MQDDLPKDEPWFSSVRGGVEGSTVDENDPGGGGGSSKRTRCMLNITFFKKSDLTLLYKSSLEFSPGKLKICK